MLGKLSRTPLSLALVGVLACGIHAAQAQQPAPAAAGAAQSSLADTLQAWRAHYRLPLQVDPSLLAGKAGAAVDTQLSAVQALQRVLAPAGLQANALPGGGFSVTRAAGQDADMVLPTLRVGDTASTPYGGKATLDATYINAQAAGNGDIGSLLKIHPAVQFDNAQLSSYTPGEIGPAEVSINGAAFYQNNFMVDGVGMNNSLDPAAEGSPYRLYGGPGSSQALALDTRLLSEITVLDSNISAAYGGFTGGVVDAVTRKPSRQTRTEVSMQMSRSQWTRYHIDPLQRDDYENASSWDDGQPEFKKSTWRATTEGWVTDTFGVLASVTRKRSDIPAMFYSSHLVDQFGAEKRTQKRAIDNLFLKGVWEASDRVQLQASLTYAPQEDVYFRSNTADSQIKIVNGGLQGKLDLDWRTDWGRVKQRLGYNRTEQSRDPSSNDWFTWYRSDSKTWGTNSNSLAGEYGDVEQRQKSLQYALDINWDAIDTGALSHRLAAGVLLGHDDYRYARLTESNIYVSPKTTSTCTNNAGVTDTVTCALGTTRTTSAATNNWPGQYFTSRTRYAAGEFGFSTLSGALYVEDDIRWGEVSVRPGLRVERDDYLSQTTVAPRIAAAWDIGGDGTSLLQAGANRYYGRSMATWRLKENINRLRYNSETRATLDSAWTLGKQQAATNALRDLDVAYDDELMLGFTRKWEALSLEAKVVDRKGRDQVIQVPGKDLGEPSTDTGLLSAAYTTWTNDGRSHNRIWSLTAKSRRPLRVAGTTTSWEAVADWTDNKYSAPTYAEDDLGQKYLNDGYIQYRGDVIHYSQLPADNYTRPWTVRLTTATHIPQWNLTVTQLLRYRAGYQDIGDTGVNVVYQGVPIDVYDRREFSGAFTWDMRIGWDKALTARQSVFVNLDVFNLLDRVNVHAVNANSIPRYETGRAFWAEVGYRF